MIGRVMETSNTNDSVYSYVGGGWSSELGCDGWVVREVSGLGDGECGCVRRWIGGYLVRLLCVCCVVVAVVEWGCRVS